MRVGTQPDGPRRPGGRLWPLDLVWGVRLQCKILQKKLESRPPSPAPASALPPQTRSYPFLRFLFWAQAPRPRVLEDCVTVSAVAVFRSSRHRAASFLGAPGIRRHRTVGILSCARLQEDGTRKGLFRGVQAAVWGVGERKPSSRVHPKAASRRVLGTLEGDGGTGVESQGSYGVVAERKDTLRNLHLAKKAVCLRGDEVGGSRPCTLSHSSDRSGRGREARGELEAQVRGEEDD